MFIDRAKYEVARLISVAAMGLPWLPCAVSRRYCRFQLYTLAMLLVACRLVPRSRKSGGTRRAIDSDKDTCRPDPAFFIGLQYTFALHLLTRQLNERLSPILPTPQFQSSKALSKIQCSVPNLTQTRVQPSHRQLAARAAQASAAPWRDAGPRTLPPSLIADCMPSCPPPMTPRGTFVLPIAENQRTVINRRLS